jgi:hypothetical protein
VRWHHYLDGLENSNLHPEIVYLANRLFHSQGAGESDEDPLNMSYSSVLKRLKITTEQYGAFEESARTWLEKLSDALSFD